ncbi:uncharacterized protein [Linepithema humile]|uniref:uncharacterized protein n=1 Tax=Linepithema humile TaxID=83485 RepID=UPI00351E6775
METSVNEEDEDVVIQGSALHVHLSNLGYADFESVSIPKRTYIEEKHYLNIDIKSAIKKICMKIFSFYSWITQERSISEKQLNVILNAEALLNDHFSIINSFLAKGNNNSKKITLQEIIVAGAVISSTYFSISKNKILSTLFASSVIGCVSSIKYLRFCANRNLQNLILTQNELLIMCKEGLKILQLNYTIKLNSETCLQQFSHFLGEKLRYLQLLAETLTEFMENISSQYYHYSLSIAKLLPPNILNEESFTEFEDDLFKISGEVNYQVLKKFYHIYLLVQSEMLYLLAIAYNSNTWTHSCQKIPEIKLAYIIHILTKNLDLYKVKLVEILNAYRTCEAKPIRYTTRDRAKWHDPTVQLDLASYKLQLAYNQIFSTFKDIDNCIIQDTHIDNETAESLLQKLNKAFKEVDTAKNLAEFVVLLLARSRFNNLRGNQPVTDSTTINQNTDLPVIIDSDPEILDEVFEEYIKEEFCPSQEETDEYSLKQQKLDKLLVKNFMSELKEALIDKHKTMSERESKALQRIYKNVSKDLILNTEDEVNKNCRFIPAPPPMPPYYIWSTLSNNEEPNTSYKKLISSNCKVENANSIVREKIEASDEQNDFIKTLKHKKIFNISSNTACENNDRDSLISLPQILLETQVKQFDIKLPPAFLQEETFIGSGENSEEEIADNVSDNDEYNENSQQ